MDIVICKPVIVWIEKEVATIGFSKLEVRIDGKDYLLSSYENKTFDLDTDTFEILNGNQIFSFIHGKEVIVSVAKLCEHGNNAQILVGEIEKKLIEENRKSYVNTAVMNEVMGGIFKLHEAHARQARTNLIDRALETGDKELFERMCRMEVALCK